MRLACWSTFTSLELAPSGEITVPETPIRVALSDLFAELIGRKKSKSGQVV